MNKLIIKGCMLAILSVGVLVPGLNRQALAQDSTTETIVLIRHGEKTAHEMGQLSIRGLNRSLAIPDVLLGKFGKPDYLFAPNPAALLTARDGSGKFCYIRPLATIEPTAIRLGMPVNTQIGYDDIKGLQAEVTKPAYTKSVIFIAWEHLKEADFARNILKAYGADASVVPEWLQKDFDSIYIIRLVRSGDKTTATFTLDQEGLNDKLSDTDPTATPPVH